MTIRLRTAFFIGLGIIFLWFLYVERAILTPFILAGIFAYIFNPVINFFSNNIKLPRTISIIIIYLIAISSVIIFSVFITRRLLNESEELRAYIESFVDSAKNQINYLPEWIRPAADEALISIKKSKIFSPVSIFEVFPQAISRIVSLFIFLFSGFYFLKDGRKLIDSILLLFHGGQRVEVEILFRKLNVVFSGYLRGQLLLSLIVSIMTFTTLSVLGIRFAFVLAVFAGFAEIVPIIGPTTAGILAFVVALITGVNNFGLSPFYSASVIAASYFIIQQVQSYLISPFVLGKITRLHPLIILFAVLSGGHISGWLGFILAVPLAAAIRIILEFAFDKINDRSLAKKYPRKRVSQILFFDRNLSQV